MGSDKWKCLYGVVTPAFAEGLDDPSEVLTAIHRMLRLDFSDAFEHANKAAIAPNLNVSTQGLGNLNGFGELLVEYIFCEKPVHLAF